MHSENASSALAPAAAVAVAAATAAVPGMNAAPSGFYI